MGRTRFDVEIIRQLIPHTLNDDSKEHVGNPGETRTSDDNRDHAVAYQVMLEQAPKEGLIEHLTSPNNYKFDRESAMELLPKGEQRLSPHMFYGRTLERISHERSGEEEATSLFLLSVHRRNFGKAMLIVPAERRRLAEQNNFLPRLPLSSQPLLSPRDLEAGLDLLEDVKWKDHYQLTVKMTLMVAHVHYCNGEQE